MPDQDIVSLFDLESRAQQRLPKPARDYYASGAHDGTSRAEAAGAMSTELLDEIAYPDIDFVNDIAAGMPGVSDRRLPGA